MELDSVRWDTLIDVVDRMNENLARLNEVVITLNNRINDLEVKLDSLRVQSKNHDHPYKYPPVYG